MVRKGELMVMGSKGCEETGPCGEKAGRQTAVRLR